MRRWISPAADFVQGMSPWRLALIGAGLILAGSPAARRAVRPLLVGTVRTGLVLADTLRGALGGLTGGWRSIIEEVRAERVAGMAAVAGAAAGAAAASALQSRDGGDGAGDAAPPPGATDDEQPVKGTRRSQRFAAQP